jgi:hypothetical protein
MKFSFAEIALARRICRKERASWKNGQSEFVPPWWKRAIAWAEDDLVWVEGQGYVKDTEEYCV